MLEERLKALNEATGLGSTMDKDRDNALMRASICNHQLSLATAQSVVSGLLVRLAAPVDCANGVDSTRTCITTTWWTHAPS